MSRIFSNRFFEWSFTRQGALSVALWAAPLVFLLVFFFYPLGAIFRLVVEAFVKEGWQDGMATAVLRPLGFTFYQAALSTVFTMLVGMPAAYVFGRFDFRGKRLVRVLTTLPFILPTVVVAASFNALFGPRGWVNLFCVEVLGFASAPVQILNTLPAIVLAHVFYNTTIVIRTVGSAWEQLDARLEQAARVLGASGWRVIWEVTLPLLRPAMLSAVVLVFLFDFTSFGVILLLGGPRYATLEFEIYNQAVWRLDLGMAGLLSAVQLACTLGLTIISSRLAGEAILPLAPRLKGEGLRRPISLRERLVVWGVVGGLALLLVSPLSALALRSVMRFEANRGQRETVEPGLTLDYYRELFINRRQSIFYVPPVEAARNSIVYAGMTVILSLSMGLLAAYSLARRSRMNRFLDALMMLPLGASAVTLGLGFIIVFNRPPLDVQSFPFLVPIAHSLVALPFVVRVVQPALVSIPPSLRQAAGVLGASPWQVWREVDLPIVARAALVGAIFSFTISLGEFGATTFLSRPDFPTLPVAISRFLAQPGALNYGQALAMATLLMVLCGLNIFLLEHIRLDQG